MWCRRRELKTTSGGGGLTMQAKKEKKMEKAKCGEKQRQQKAQSLPMNKI